MKWFEVDHEGTIVKVAAQRIGQQIWYHYLGETFVWEKPERTPRSTSTSVPRNLLTAPMPGKITAVMKAIGESVNLGEVVIVMEAMKMEYSLKAECHGKVKSLKVAVDSQVSLGEILVEFAIDSEGQGDRSGSSSSFGSEPFLAQKKNDSKDTK